MQERYVVAVRALCEFAAKRGDLDLRFTPSPTAQEGMAGHALVRTRRAADYETEITLSGDYGPLHVRGRADGYDPSRRRLEEIKTFRGDLSRMRDNQRHLHWAQLKIYGWLFCASRAIDRIELALVYVDIGNGQSSGQETVLTETATARDLQAFFDMQCAHFLDWAMQELAHRAARDTGLTALRFPHADFRPGQRPLCEAIYRGAVGARRLLAQAPTGIGKTVGTLFPLLKACPGQSIDKIYYLAAKTSGRAMAIDALRKIGSSAIGGGGGGGGSSNGGGSDRVEGVDDPVAAAASLPVRVVELVARDKACEHPDKACHGDACPLARGFYDRLPAARADAVNTAILDQATMREIALRHEVCPYYLSQEMVRWSDVVIGDYNYYFDLNAMLYALMQVNQWRVSILVDEAHNLLERARAMYSAELHPLTLQTARRRVPASAPVVKKALSQVSRHWKALVAASPSTAPSRIALLPRSVKAASASDAANDMGSRTDTGIHAGTEAIGATAGGGIRSKVLPALQQAIVAIMDHLAERPDDMPPEVLRFGFDAMHFVRIAELFDPLRFSDRVDIEAATSATSATSTRTFLPVLTLRNLIPSVLLRPRFTQAHSVALFSATLTPWQFYADTLGLPDDSVWVDVPSPFRAEQLQVRIADTISTRWQDRERSLAVLVSLMATQYRTQPGNYLAFFSSYDYLQQAAKLLRQQHPDIPIREQAPGMREREQAAFLAAFTAQSRGIGFAVLGGAFSEGVDLPGERLIGAFVATLGLPQWSAANEEIKACMASNFGAVHGYDYAYLFPGLRKVVQAAGRVIRGPTDTGVVYLLDDRFARADVRRLLPSWWQVERIKGHIDANVDVCVGADVNDQVSGTLNAAFGAKSND